MSESQFEKRRAKAEAVLKSKKQSEDVEIEPQEVKSSELTHEGYDVFLDKDKRSYRVAVFKYNPETQEVKLTETVPVQRIIGLQTENQKRALKTLLKRK